MSLAPQRVSVATGTDEEGFLLAQDRFVAVRVRLLDQHEIASGH